MGYGTLSPVRDLLTTIHYKDRTMPFAMDERAANLKGWHFVEFAARHGFPEPVVRSMLEMLASRFAPDLVGLETIVLGAKETAYLRSEIERRLKLIAEWR